MADIDNLDLSEVKTIDENGEAQNIELDIKPQPEEEETTEKVEETQVEDTSENKTEVEETKEEPVSEPEGEEPKEEEEENKEIGKPDELFSKLDSISKELSGGKAETLEDFFDEYKRMRDSSDTQFKDDFIKNAVEYYNANGSLTPFLEASSVNYEEMSDEKVMRRNLVNEHPTLSDKAIERLYQRDIVQKYSLDEDKYDEDEVELGKELLQADASKLRKTFVDEQKEFTAPQKTEESKVDQEEIVSKWTETVSTSESTKSILENKSILVDYNGDKFSYEVEDPKKLEEMTVDNNKFFDLFKDDKGSVDFDKWYRVLAYATDPDVYDSSLISHGQELGQEKVVSDLKNPSKPTKAQSDYKQPNSPLEGLIGALSRGDSDVKIIR
tara:strand:+ start:6459 stop:7610 length:1152 start_codon:yes stop_codon:yes gene_type:complete